MINVRNMRTSNFSLSLVSDGRRDLLLACEILLEPQGPCSGATHYIKQDGWLVFTCETNAAPQGAQPLLYPMDYEALTDLIVGWLDSLGAKSYPPRPACDGSVEMGGFEITSAGCYFDVLFKVRPAWRVYGK